VKKSHVLAVLAGSVLLMTLVVVGVPAQQGMQPAAATYPANQIALIDVGLIFKQHTRFKQHMADLEADMKRAEEVVRKERDTLRAMSEKLADYGAGTPEYKQLEEEIAKRTADLNVRFTLQRKEFAKTEAKIWHMVFQEIQQEVDAFAQANGIAAVLRFSSEQPDPEKPDEVLRDLNKPVIWYARNLDITPIVLNSLNRRALQTDQRATPGPARFPRK